MTPIRKKSLTNILYIILNILWWIELIGSGILLVTVLITFFWKKNIRLNFPVSFSTVTFKTVQPVSKTITTGVLEVMDGNFYLPVDNTLQNIIFLLAGSIVVSAVLLFITYQLKLIFLTLRNNEPFNESNVARIRNIGIAFIFFSILQFLSNVFINQFLFSHFSLEKEIALTYTFKISYLITGLVFIIAAEIFKEGTALKEETNLTI